MSTSKTAQRRRRQAKMGYKHMDPLDRPHYTKVDADTSSKRLSAIIARQKALQARKGAKK